MRRKWQVLTLMNQRLINGASMANNTKNYGVSGGAMIVVVLIIVGGFLYMNGNTHSLTSGSNNNSNQTLGTIVTQPNTQTFLGKVQYIDFSQTPPQPTLVGSQTINCYIPGQGTVQYTGTSSSSGGVTIPSTGNINWKTWYLCGSGNGISYLHNYTRINSGANSSVPLLITVDKYAADTVQVQNSSAVALSQRTVIHKAAAGQTVTTASINIQAGKGFDSTGQKAIIFIYNSLAISSINLQGATPVSMGLLPAVNYVTSNSVDTEWSNMGKQNTAVAFLLPQSSYYAYTGTGSSSATLQSITPTITLSSNYGANEIVGVEIVPADNYFNPSTGTVDQNIFINPTTQAALVTPVLIANAIQITPT